MDSMETPQYPPAETPAPPERDGPAWEWRERLGFARALALTIKEVLTQPAAAFGRMRVEGGWDAPFQFYLTMHMIVGFIGLLMFRAALPGYLKEIDTLAGSMGGGLPLDMGSVKQTLTHLAGVSFPFVVIGWLIVYPIWLLMVVWSLALQSHVILAMLGGARERLEATFRATAYVGGACAWLSLIPVIGSIAWLVFWTIVYIVALTAVHRTQTWRAVVAVVLPAVALVVVLFVLLAVMMTLVGGLGSFGG